MFERLLVSSSILSNCNNYPNGEEVKNDYLDFYKANIDCGKYCTKSWGLASYEAGAASRQGEIDELQKRIDDALNMLDSLQEQHWKKWKECADMMDQGASNAYEHSYWILKGQNNG